MGPRKRESMARAREWTGDAYKGACRYMRGGVSSNTAAVIPALTAYMKHSAPVAPVAPRGMPQPQVLWRGVLGTPPRPGTTVSSNGGCFTSFSRLRHVAVGYGGAGVDEGYVLRLQVDRIARGTPWAWFVDVLDDRDRQPPPRWKDTLGTYFENDGEVLLPPGYFKVLGVHAPRDATIVVDVAYVPRPEYVRRGAVPRFDSQGRVVARTIGGHQVVTNHAAVATNVRRRRNRLAVAAARASLRSRVPARRSLWPAVAPLGRRTSS